MKPLFFTRILAVLIVFPVTSRSQSVSDVDFIKVDSYEMNLLKAEQSVEMEYLEEEQAEVLKRAQKKLNYYVKNADNNIANLKMTAEENKKLEEKRHESSIKRYDSIVEIVKDFQISAKTAKKEISKIL